MKKLLIVLLLAALLPLSALTETNLWPAYDPNAGLWGYITEDGTWSIAPRFEYASHFSNGYAIVGMDGYYDDQGLIDETGAYIFQPVYDYVDWGTIGYDTWVYNDVYLIGKDGLYGWFDPESGYISGLCWEHVESWDDSPYVIAGVGDRCTFVHRATGERLLPLMDMFTFGFSDERAMCWLDKEKRFLIVDQEGRIIQLPEGVKADADAYACGLLIVQGDNGLYGYVDVEGRVVIEPQYEDVDFFTDGYAVVQKDGEKLLIDRENRVIAQGWDYVCGLWADDGIAVARENGWAVLNQDGMERFCVPLEPYEYGRFIKTYPPLVDGSPWWVRYRYPAVSTDFGLMTADGVWLHDAEEPEDFFALAGDMFSDDPMGWHAAWHQGKWGFIDGAGNTVLPFIYEDAGHFDGALAWVQLDGDTGGYINRSGEVVYSWRIPDVR